MRWGRDGVKPDPEKCDRIQSKPAPTNVKELQSFLGRLQYIAPFVPHLSSKSDILRKLLKSDTDFDWTEDHERVFKDLKSMINADMNLRFFNPQEKCTIEVDASLNRLGAALVQGAKPVAFSWKALTDAERHYANIERELLAVVHGCETFHTYIYGSQFRIETDHKPLEQIHIKNIIQVPPRLQRMLLRLQPYDFMLSYKPGMKWFLQITSPGTPRAMAAKLN